MAMPERRLSQVLTRRFSRVAWTTLAGYALVVILVFATAAEMALRRSLEHSADVIQSLLGAYRDSTSAPGSVMPSALADQLVGMGGQVVITRTTTNAGGMPQVYYLSPGMPAKRLEGLPTAASPEQVRSALVAAITQKAHWRYRVLHRVMGEFDLYVVASRQSYFVPLGILVAAAALLLPLAALVAARGAKHAVDEGLQPLERVTAETRAIGPAELGTRLTSPTGQTEVTDLAESINRMLERVDRAHRALQSFTADASHELRTTLTHHSRRRCRSHPAHPPQSRVERGSLHAARQRHICHRTQWHGGRRERAGHGTRHRAGACRPHLRPLLSNRSVPQPRAGWHRPWTRDRAALRRVAEIGRAHV